MLYYCGLLGYHTKHLLKSITAIENEGGLPYIITVKYDYWIDIKNRPIKVVYTVSDDSESYKINYTWKDR